LFKEVKYLFESYPKIYKLIAKQEKNSNKNLIRSIFVGWDNYTRYSKLKNNVTTFILPNSFDFYFIV